VLLIAIAGVFSSKLASATNRLTYLSPRYLICCWRLSHWKKLQWRQKKTSSVLPLLKFSPANWRRQHIKLVMLP